MTTLKRFPKYKIFISGLLVPPSGGTRKTMQLAMGYKCNRAAISSATLRNAIVYGVIGTTVVVQFQYCLSELGASDVV